MVTDSQKVNTENNVSISNCRATKLFAFERAEPPPLPLYADAGAAPAGDPVTLTSVIGANVGVATTVDPATLTSVIGADDNEEAAACSDAAP